MKILSYAPCVEAYIKLENGKIIDVSRDIVQWSVQRNVDAPSTASLTISNKNNKYNMVIKPMDRIIVFATKLNRIQLFSGYVDEAPYLNIWRRDVTIKASDTIKRLMNLYWDAGLPEAVKLYNQSSNLTDDDAGFAAAAKRILTQVAEWPEDKIYITKLPDEFIKWAKDIWLSEVLELAKDAKQAQENFAKLLNQEGTSSEGTSFDGTATLNGDRPEYISEEDWQKVTLAAQKYQFDVYIMAAIGWQETQWGRTGRGRPSHGGYIFGYGVPTSGAVMTKYAGVDAQIEALGKRLNQWSVFLGHPVTSKEDLMQFQVGGPGSPMGYKTDEPEPWVENVYKKYVELKSQNSTKSAVSKTETVSVKPGVTLLGSASAYIDIPYRWGGEGPDGYDCSGFTQRVAKDLGFGDIPHNTSEQIAWFTGKGWSVEPSQIQPGDYIYFKPGRIHHVGIFVGDGKMVEAPYTGQKIGVNPIREEIAFAGRLPGVTVGEIDPAKAGTSITPVSNGATDSTGENPLQQAFWAMYLAPVPSTESLIFTGQRALINDEPVWNKVQELLNASMRSVSTAPDGSLVAWFPDKFGIYGSKTPYFMIEDIEINDISITKSDRPIATHVFCAGTMSHMMDFDNISDWINTPGVVSMEKLIDSGGAAKNIIESIMNIPEEEKDSYKPENFLARYGARPLKMPPMTLINNRSVMPFMYALWKFMEQWTKQFSVSADFTFMPELFPGGRVAFAGHDLEMYVESVTHSGSYTSGFTTSASLSCPVSKTLPGMIRPGS